MKLVGTGQTDNFTAIRELYMKNCVGFILTYSVASLRTLNDLVDMREQILRVKDCDDVPLVLVGTFKRGDERPREVTTEQGKELAERFDCQLFEIDVHDRKQIDAVITALLPKAILWKGQCGRKRKEKDRDCVVM